MSDKAIKTKKILSEIIHNKKQLILKVDQTSDFVYPNELYKYQIYCKNVSGSRIDNIRIQILNPSAISIDEDDSFINEGIPIGSLENGQSHLIFVKARCNKIGEFTVHFLCLGEESELVTKKLNILSAYNISNKETVHKIHIYNFEPYEEKYEFMSTDYNEEVTQLIKKQKLPYGAYDNPFPMYSDDPENNIYVDESQDYLDQMDILYGDPEDSDEHSYQYLQRENFNKNKIESFEGESLREIFDNINKTSKLFKAKFIRTGTNKLLNRFKQYYPDGFIYRMGLMTSEIFHHVGVIPDYSYMNDYIFKWAAENSLPLNLYPKHIDMKWYQNKWAGHGWNVWKTYTDEYKEQIIDTEDYKPYFEFIHTFDDIQTAEQYISNEYEYDTSNEYYIYTDEGIEKIRKYQFIIKESYFDNGVFFVHIPLNKIPSNFLLLDTDEIESIVEKTKPYGMKGLIKYVIDVGFNIDFNFKTYNVLYPMVKLNYGEIDNITYSMVPYKYNDIIETVCSYKNGEPVYEERNAIRLIPDGIGYHNSSKFYLEPKINILPSNPTNLSDISLNTQLTYNAYQCQVVKRLVKLNDIIDLLYQNNFDDVSFHVNDIILNSIHDTNIIDEKDSLDINYKLWKDCLFSDGQKNNNSNACWWDVEVPNENYIPNEYYLSDMIDKNDEVDVDRGRFDFFEISTKGLQFYKDNTELGIGFQDIDEKLHGFSIELDTDLSLFKVRYATSLNNNFNVIKDGASEPIGLAFKFIHIGHHTLIIFFIKTKGNKDAELFTYHYFTHVVVRKIKSIFCFSRDSYNIKKIKKWSNIIKIGKNVNPEIIFDTPSYHNIEIYDPNSIIYEELTNWRNINRLDYNENSYTIIENNSNYDVAVSDINLHFDDFNIPDDAIIEKINMHAIVESNANNKIYPSIRLQDGFITQQSNINSVSLQPKNIECYPFYNNNLDYYKEIYEIAKTEDIDEAINNAKQKIIENEIFNESLDYSLDYLKDPDEYIVIKKPYWCEVSEFCNYNISFNDVSDIKFCIEGYNYGKEIYLMSQLRYKNDHYAEKNKTIIPSGYFKEYISLPYNTNFFLDEIKIRFRFLNLNTDLEIFDTYTKVYFKRKESENKKFIKCDGINAKDKKIINIDLLDDNYCFGYMLKDGLTTKLQFDDLDIGEYYKIYSIRLQIMYKKQNIDFLINSNNSQIDNNNIATLVSGKTSNQYTCGKFMNEVIMPGTYQPESTITPDDLGIELKDTLYQSFVATKDNITGITLYPNGFVGRPDVNLKISLYDNKNHTPNKLIKEITVKGWTKENNQLEDNTIINYDFLVNNLKIGEKYWIGIKVVRPSENDYYLLHYKDSSTDNLKLLAKINNNLINTFGVLKFHINTLNEFHSFNSLPAIEDSEDFSDPQILLRLNKKLGEAKNIIIQKIINK